MSQFDPFEHFPDLTPIESVPLIFNLLGCGLILYGDGDRDFATGSYVKTRYLCLFSVPLIAVSTYRIIDTPAGSLILGKVSPSNGSRIYSAFVVALAIFLGGFFVWRETRSNPTYIAQQQLNESELLTKQGNFADAARGLGEVALGPTDLSKIAIGRLIALIESSEVRKSSGELGGVFKVAVNVQKAGRWPESPETLFRQARDLIKLQANSAPVDAIAVLEAIAPLAPKGEDLDAIRLDLLNRIVTLRPDDPEWATKLAVILERPGVDERLEAVLSRHRAKLGASEGARILGLVEARKGRVGPALALLRPYTAARLERLRSAERSIKSTIETAQRREIDRIERQRPGDFNFKRYYAEDKDEQSRMIEEYINPRIKDDPAIKAAQDRFIQEAGVVPVTLDLAILLIQQSQIDTTPEDRTSDLNEAEATFLSISRIAGKSDEYRLNLARVKYWLGKHSEGRELFEEFLKEKRRDPQKLIDVADDLRQLGSENEARELAVEAYNSARDEKIKQSAALNRALMTQVIQEQILWLERSDQENPEVKAILSQNRAQQSLQAGDEIKAIEYLRETIRTIDLLPESAPALNNKSNALFLLAELTGEDEVYNQGLAAIEKSVSLDPTNTLSMNNAADALLDAGLRRIIGRSIDLRLLKRRADLDLIRLLARDQAGRDEYARQLGSDPLIVRAMALFDKLLLLAPRLPDSYEKVAEILAFRRDAQGQQNLLKRLEGIDFRRDDGKFMVPEFDPQVRDEVVSKALESSMAGNEQILAIARSRGVDATFAAAALRLVRIRAEAAETGIRVDLSAVLPLAEEAYAAAPSSLTREVLIMILLIRADDELNRAEPDYASLVEKWRGSLSAYLRIAIALEREGPARTAAVKHPDVKKAIELARESFQATPIVSASGRTWCLLLPSYPDEAAAVARTMLEDQSDRLRTEISRRLRGVSPYDELESHWRERMQGKGPEVFELAPTQKLESPLKKPEQSTFDNNL